MIMSAFIPVGIVRPILGHRVRIATMKNFRPIAQRRLRGKSNGTSQFQNRQLDNTGPMRPRAYRLISINALELIRNI